MKIKCKHTLVTQIKKNPIKCSAPYLLLINWRFNIKMEQKTKLVVEQTMYLNYVPFN